MKRPKIIAHRGLSALYPENTMIAFRKALELPVDAIEFDVHPTRDGALVLTHDDTLDRCSNGAGPVRDYTLAELAKLDFGSWKAPEFTGIAIPTLQEVLDEALKLRPDLYFCVELKENDRLCAEKTIEELKKRNLLNRCSIISFHDEMLFYAKQLDSRVFPHGFVPRWPEKLEPGDERLKLFKRIGVPQKSLSTELVNYYHSFNIEVDTWAPDTIEELKTALGTNLDTVTTNAPQAILPYF